jgi:DNA-directed RNA polymerase subunit RPC12/RpoP
MGSRIIMSYRCAKCGTIVQTIAEGLVRCPSCGHRILYKTRDPIAKTIKVD